MSSNSHETAYQIKTRMESFFRETRPKICVVDDISEARQHLKRQLSNLSAKRVSVFSSAESALKSMRSIDYDIVLCDLNLSGGNSGAWLLESCRQQNLLKSNAIFIIVSGEASADRLHPVLSLSPDEYLVKPFSERQLCRRLLKCVDRKRQFSNAKEWIRQGIAPMICIQRLLSGGIKTNTIKVNAFKSVGEALIEKEDYAEAINLYSQSLRYFSGRHHVWAHVGKATALMKEGLLNEALKEFNLAISLSSFSTQAYVGVGLCHEQLGQYDEALRCAKEIASRASTSEPAILRVIEMAKLANDPLTQEEASYRYVRLGRDLRIDFGARLCIHLEVCVQLMNDGYELSVNAMDRFNKSLQELKRLKHLKPQILSNAYKAELTYYLFLNKVGAAEITYDRWMQAIKSGLASKLSDAQMQTLSTHLLNAKKLKAKAV